MAEYDIIDRELFKQAREFIPQMINFKLSSIINGSKSEQKEGNQAYIPPKLLTIMKKDKVS
jgi:hypothetical protein